MILIIDITSPETLRLRLLDKFKIRTHQSYHGRRQNLLLRLDRFLKLRKLNWGVLGGLALIEGVGSFSGARQAVAILNTLAMIKDLPVAGFDRRRYINDQALLVAINDHFQRQTKVKFIQPIYSGQPNIRS